jgi:hypothetical protein
MGILIDMCKGIVIVECQRNSAHKKLHAGQEILLEQEKKPVTRRNLICEVHKFQGRYAKKNPRSPSGLRGWMDQALILTNGYR